MNNPILHVEEEVSVQTDTDIVIIDEVQDHRGDHHRPEDIKKFQMNPTIQEDFEKNSLMQNFAYNLSAV